MFVFKCGFRLVVVTWKEPLYNKIVFAYISSCIIMFDVLQVNFFYYNWNCLCFTWQNKSSRIETTNWSSVWGAEEDIGISTVPFRHWCVCQEASKCKAESNCCQQYIAECTGNVIVTSRNGVIKLCQVLMTNVQLC